MAYNFARFFGGVENNFRTVMAEGEVVVVEHRLSATLPNGRSYVNDYCFVYELRDGKVWRIREYMDTRGGWAQVFGNGEPRQLVEFIAG
jgi:ketosteroid isomerase-like protein